MRAVLLAFKTVMVVIQDVKLCGPTYTASAVNEKWDGLLTRGLLVHPTQKELALSMNKSLERC
jgi:hypothetical protein